MVKLYRPKPEKDPKKLQAKLIEKATAFRQFVDKRLPELADFERSSREVNIVVQ
ncbi:hypothetical protein HQ571_05480 [Candidatus Kuenenbacteria bacterium]|nr:hypothetical protein [Candidatus Kuenenbacteria bacterium]